MGTSTRRKRVNESRITLTRIQGRVCAYCFERMEKKRKIANGCHVGTNPRCSTADHAIPRSRGGTDDIRNLAAVHSACNTAKGNRMPTGCELIGLAWVHALLEAQPLDAKTD